MELRVLDIVEGTSVDGPGLRTSLYFAGCHHACPGCHNPESWDFNGGELYDLTDLVKIIKDNDFDVTFSGGDPLYHPKEIAELSKRIKDELGKNIWCYTGFQWEEIQHNETLFNAIQNIDVIVDGSFVQSLRDLSLLFRGSSNQRIINVKESIAKGEAIEVFDLF